MRQAYHGARLNEASYLFNRKKEDFVDFSSNLNVFWPEISPDTWQSWLREASCYPEVELESLQKSMASTYGVDNYHSVIPVAGGIDGIYLATRVLAEHVSSAAVLSPSFSDYARALRSTNVAFKEVVLTLEEWQQAGPIIKEKIMPYDLILLGNPNNPTGTYMDASTLMGLMQDPQLKNKKWLIDEAFIEFVDDSVEGCGFLPYLADLPQVMVIRSLTKSWRIPGLRLGFCATSNTRWLSKMSSLQPPWIIYSVAQCWARDFLNKNQYGKLKESLRNYQEVKKDFVKELEQLGLLQIFPSAVNYLLLKILDESMDAVGLYKKLGEQGILIRPCHSFTGLQTNRFIRVAVRLPEENQLLIQALHKSVSHEQEQRLEAHL
ncbi:MAG: aminotransferase class I/II-fold pyridoxal phosphate-dependent enzyme [Verrucomicrobiota bacterium]